VLGLVIFVGDDKNGVGFRQF